MIVIDGDKLKALRIDQGLTQQTLAYESDTSVKTISCIENGRLHGGTRVLNKLAKRLGVEADELLKQVV